MTLSRKTPLKRSTSQLQRSRMAPGRKRLGPGRRMKAWQEVRAWLLPRLEAAGRTSCEFGFIPHVCGGPLDPAHSKKRREMQGNDIYAVAVACRTVHMILDEKMGHEAMEIAVLRAIGEHGGMISPDSKAA